MLCYFDLLKGVLEIAHILVLSTQHQLDAEFGKMFEGKGEMLIRRWESSVIPKLKRIAALEKGSVTTLLDQNPNFNDAK